MATDYQALADQHLEEVAQILEEYGAAELEIGHQLQVTEADRLATGQQTIETVELPDSPPEDAGPTPQETPVDATSAPPVSEPTLTEVVDSAPSPRTDATGATTPTPPNMPLQTDKCTTMEQPAHADLTSEQTTAPADLTPEPEPFEPLQKDEPTEEKGTEVAITEPPSVTTPPTDPTPPEPSILDIFDDA